MGGDWPTRPGKPVVRPDPRPQVQVLPDQPVAFQALAHAPAGGFLVEGLGDEVVGPPLHGLHRQFDAAIGGHHDDREPGVLFPARTPGDPSPPISGMRTSRRTRSTGACRTGAGPRRARDAVRTSTFFISDRRRCRRRPSSMSVFVINDQESFPHGIILTPRVQGQLDGEPGPSARLACPPGCRRHGP